MKNRTVYSALLIALLYLGIVSTSISANDKAPIFIDCPGNLRACMFDSVFVQVKAVHPNSEQAKSIRYFLVDGVGEVDSMTGVWSYFSEDKGQAFEQRTIEIGASIGKSPHQTYTSENCRFQIRIGRPMTHYIYIGDNKYQTVFVVKYGQRFEAPVSVYELFGCSSQLSIESVTPLPVNPIRLVDDSILAFEPDIADMNKRFEIVIRSDISGDIVSRLFMLDTREHIPAPVFVECPDSTVDIDPCAFSGVSIKAVDPEYGNDLGVIYEKLEGPGSVGGSDGDWHYHFNVNQDHEQFFDVEIKASYAGVETSESENCRFSVQVANLLPPDFSRYDDNPCGDTVEAMAEIDSLIVLKVAQSDMCGLMDLELQSISPMPVGEVEVNPYPKDGTVRVEYNFAPEDAGKLFAVKASASTLFDRSECEFYIKVKEFVPIAVRIGQVFRASPGQHVKVPISLDGSPVELGGFNFVIGYDASALSFYSAEAGSAFYGGGCEWEYFTYRYGADGNCSGNCPSGLLRVIGIAETNNGPDEHAKCLLPEELPAEIANLDFLVGNDRTFECRTIPLSFFWLECNDNTLSDPQLFRNYISRRVLDTCHYDISNPNLGAYPTYQGAQNIDCYSQRDREIYRWVDFYNGYIKITCADTVNPIGDLNMNEIELELADFQMLLDYALYGDTVFHINIDGQLYMADIDRDGVSGTANDVASMLTHMNGTRIPCSDYSPLDDTLFLSSADGTLNITFESKADIGALYLTIAGEVEPTLQQADLTLLYHYDSSRHQTKVVIYSMNLIPIQDGQILSGVSGHAILSASAGSTTGRMIPVSFADVNLIKVRIEKQYDVLQGQIEDVSIILDQAPLELGGFEFQIKYDPSVLIVNEVLAGSAIGDSACGWKYFGHQLESPGLLRIAGIAAVNGNPSCFTPGEIPAELARVRFLITNDRTYECAYVPIQFYWGNCGSNSLTDRHYDSLFISKRVFDTDISSSWTEITDPTVGYPTISGAQDSDCFADSTEVPYRRIEFYNGGLDIVCADSIDSRCSPGDLNMNDYWDEGDAILYANYFVYGMGVFYTHEVCQFIASDVNRDDIPLTLEDFTYLLTGLNNRIILHPITPVIDTAFLNYYDGKLDLEFASEDSIGAMLIVVSDSVAPVLDAENVEFLYWYNGEETRMLVYSMLLYPIDPGPILSNLGDYEITEISAATTDGRQVQTSYNEWPPISFRIATVSDPGPDSLFELPIYLDQEASEIGGFNLLVRYDAEAMAVTDVMRGTDLFDINGCNWQHFTYHLEQPGYLNIVGIARAASDPTCYTPYSLPAEIARMQFKLINGHTFECQFVPVRFYWEDCTDNVVADRYGDSLFVSSRVFDVVAPDIPIQDPFDGYPSYLGAQNEDCFGNVDRRPYRRVEFTNGGFHNSCTGPVDIRGDINLNEIGYEIDDALLFADYLIYGAGVFTRHYEAQLEATDINQDSVTATLEDLTYLLSVTNQNYLPLPIAPSRDTLYYEEIKNNQLRVQFVSEDEIGALLVTIKDSVEPKTALEGFTLLYHYDGVITRALLYSLDQRPIPPGVLLTNLRKQSILNLQAASTMGRRINSVTGTPNLLPAGDAILPTSFAVYQNYPNPFNPSTTIRFDLPQPATVRFKVFNILGATVYDYQHDYPAGQHELKWMGKSNEGELVASGVYYYRIDAGSFSQTRKMLLLK